jgi:hypothetical protein
VVLFYGVVSAQTEKVVEFFLEREAGEAMIGEVREEEAELAEELRIETIEPWIYSRSRISLSSAEALRS